MEQPPLPDRLPPGQQLVARDKWPIVGERLPAEIPAEWTLSVAGLVGQPRSWTLAQLRELPQVTRTVDIHCVTRWTKLDVIFAGVPLVTLLERTGIAPEARYVSFVAHSPREHATSLQLSDALALETLIVLDYAGQPLPVDHGGPVRGMVPGRYFYKSVKWLTRIELLAEDRLGYWEAEAGYHNHADPWKEERFLAPALDKRTVAVALAARDFQQLDLRGLAAAGHDLTGLNARSAMLRDADLRKAILRTACFDRANLSGARLQLADLQQATFCEADLEGANFSGCDLRGANFAGASLFGASFFPAAGEPDCRAPVLDARTKLANEQLEQLTDGQASQLLALLDSLGLKLV